MYFTLKQAENSFRPWNKILEWTKQFNNLTRQFLNVHNPRKLKRFIILRNW